MTLAQVTQTGNVSIPKKWRDELNIEPNSKVSMERHGNKIIIEPMKKEFHKILHKIDDEMKRKNIHFTREESIKDDLYD